MNISKDILLNRFRFVYFIGIGGIGMSGLARYFKSRGKEVFGYDKTPTSLTDELIGEGMSVHFKDDIQMAGGEKELLSKKNEMLVVYTPAVPKDHNELNFFANNGFTTKKRAEVLGMITSGSFNVAVAGTHGKTTTSSMIAHLFTAANRNCSAFLGGIAKNYNSNLLIAKENDNEVVVAEADEYDRSFLQLSPDVAVITSLDADHLDIYGDHAEMIRTYKAFSERVKPGGKLITRSDLGFENKGLTYTVKDSEADYKATNIRIQNRQYIFDIQNKKESISGIRLGLPGRHNVENAVAAVAAAMETGLSAANIKSALETYSGVRRRFDLQFTSDQLVYIDDYAHHPEELKACIHSVKEMYPELRITGIFQPHLYSRTRDFADGFAESLSLLDELWMLDIYPAREEPIPGVSSLMILERAKNQIKKLLRKEEVLEEIGKVKSGLILTLGAGDIDQLVLPIKKILEKK